MADEVRLIDVSVCPVCGLEHKGRRFWRNFDIAGNDVQPPYTGYCPETANPISVVANNEGAEKIVAIY